MDRFLAQCIEHCVDDRQWIQHFKNSCSTFNYVLAPNLWQKANHWRKPTDPWQRRAIPLWLYFTLSKYQTVSCLFCVGISTVCMLVCQMTMVLKDMLPKWFIWVTNGAHLDETIAGIGDCSFPMGAGAIDGTHFSIIAPRHDPGACYNRKGWHFIVLQAVDHKYW